MGYEDPREAKAPLPKPVSVDEAPVLRVALADLLRQVTEFCETHGEADFYTGNALAALRLSSAPEHLSTLLTLRSTSIKEVE